MNYLSGGCAEWLLGGCPKKQRRSLAKNIFQSFKSQFLLLFLGGENFTYLLTENSANATFLGS